MDRAASCSTIRRSPSSTSAAPAVSTAPSPTEPESSAAGTSPAALAHLPFCWSALAAHRDRLELHQLPILELLDVVHVLRQVACVVPVDRTRGALVVDVLAVLQRL